MPALRRAEEGEVKLWDLTRESDFRSIQTGSALAVAFDQRSDRIRTVGLERVLHEWEPDGRDIQIATEVDLTDEWLTPSAVADFSDDGRRLAMISRDGRTIKLFNAASGRELAALTGLTAPATYVDCGADGRRIGAVARLKTDTGVTAEHHSLGFHYREYPCQIPARLGKRSIPARCGCPQPGWIDRGIRRLFIRSLVGQRGRTSPHLRRGRRSIAPQSVAW